MQTVNFVNFHLDRKSEIQIWEIIHTYISVIYRNRNSLRQHSLQLLFLRSVEFA